MFRRIWTTPRPANPPPGWTPTQVVGTQPIDPGTVARIVKARGAAAGFDAAVLSGHCLKRGAMNTAKDRRVHPARLKQLGRHASYYSRRAICSRTMRSMGCCSEHRAASSRRSATTSHRISPTEMRRPGNADASSASVGPWLVTVV